MTKTKKEKLLKLIKQYKSLKQVKTKLKAYKFKSSGNSVSTGSIDFVQTDNDIVLNVQIGTDSRGKSYSVSREAYKRLKDDPDKLAKAGQVISEKYYKLMKKIDKIMDEQLTEIIKSI